MRNDFDGLDDRYSNDDYTRDNDHRWKTIDDDDNYYIQSGYYSRPARKKNSYNGCDEYDGWNDID